LNKPIIAFESPSKKLSQALPCVKFRLEMTILQILQICKRFHSKNPRIKWKMQSQDQTSQDFACFDCAEIIMGKTKGAYFFISSRQHKMEGTI
jgi:hypothetical protein